MDDGGGCTSTSSDAFSSIPVIDIAALSASETTRRRVAGEIGRACRESGFFYAVGHGVEEDLQRQLFAVSRQFFVQDTATKRQIRMSLGGRAWRGYFGVGDELTSGVADHKEGIYFGAELDTGGLEVRSRSRWIAAPPIPGSFVCNIGDMLDRMTRGRFRSTSHRVRNPGAHDRLSCAFFFDPNFFARVQPIEIDDREVPADDRAQRWDRASVHAFDGTYGDYLLNKVGKVFPALRRDVL